MINVMLDTLIIGAGPAGLTAYLFSLMYGLAAANVGDLIGGKLVQAPRLFDYPGVSETTGKDLVTQLLVQLAKHKGEPVFDEVTTVSIKNPDPLEFAVTTKKGTVYAAKTLILATGNGNKQRENRTVVLAEQLGLKTEKGYIVTTETVHSDKPGVFAAGDCLVYPKSMEQMATSVSTGVKAAAAVFEYLKKSRPPILWGETKIPRN